MKFLTIYKVLREIMKNQENTENWQRFSTLRTARTRPQSNLRYDLPMARLRNTDLFLRIFAVLMLASLTRTQ